MDREKLLGLLETVEQRTAGYVAKLLKDKDFSAFVHRFDYSRKPIHSEPTPERKASREREVA